MTIRKVEKRKLTSGIFKPLDGVRHDLDATQKARALLLVHFLVVPDADRNRISLANVADQR